MIKKTDTPSLRSFFFSTFLSLPQSFPLARTSANKQKSKLRNTQKKGCAYKFVQKEEGCLCMPPSPSVFCLYITQLSPHYCVPGRMYSQIFSSANFLGCLFSSSLVAHHQIAMHHLFYTRILS